MRPSGSVLLCPTIAPAQTEAIAVRLAALAIDAIDAPMSGGPARARAGTMSLMVACADAALERHRALLDALADPVFRIGTRPGDGARAKLVNNLLAAVNLAGAAEALALAECVGLDPARMLDVIERSSGQSWIGSDRMRRAIAGDLVPRAHDAARQGQRAGDGNGGGRGRGAPARSRCRRPSPLPSMRATARRTTRACSRSSYSRFRDAG